MTIRFQPIGYFSTPFKSVRGMPIQPTGARGIYGAITILPDYREGLVDLEGFSHVFVLYHLHEIRGYELIVTPFLDRRRHGIFATRSPKRPNPIGLSVLRLDAISEDMVILENVDVLDGTPVIDIKPYVPDFDSWETDAVGWFAGKSANAVHYQSDERFTNAGFVQLEN